MIPTTIPLLQILVLVALDPSTGALVATVQAPEPALEPSAAPKPAAVPTAAPAVAEVVQPPEPAPKAPRASKRTAVASAPVQPPELVQVSHDPRPVSVPRPRAPAQHRGRR